MKYVALILLLSGCAAPLSREPANPVPEPIGVVPENMPAITSPYTPESMPVVMGGSNIEDMPSFPVPIERIRVTNALRMTHNDFVAVGATNGSNAYQNGSRAKDAWLAMAYKGDTNQIEAYKERSELHKAYLKAWHEHDTNALEQYRLTRTNRAKMKWLYDTNIVN